MAIGNSYFQFKQFTVHQQHCAQKVSTDACILGAWTPIFSNVKKILDIGTGTGLLCLMLAARSDQATFLGADIEQEAVTQAKLNFEASPWSNRLQALLADIRNATLPQQYDLIISNPPFFNNSLLSNNDQRNAARHTQSLTYQDLIIAFDRHLSEKGYASVLLPFPEYHLFHKLATQAGWFLCRRLMIRHKPTAPIKRVAFLMSKYHALDEGESMLTIRESTDSYTPAFSKLLSPYYLHL